MLKLTLCAISFAISVVLYCCVRCSTPYDRMIDDLEQEKFIREWKG